MSYKGSYLISKCELIPNGSSLEENYDIARGNPSINYYKNGLLKPIQHLHRIFHVNQYLLIHSFSLLI